MTVGDTVKGEWLEYKGIKLGGGNYRFTLRVATDGPGKTIKFNGKQITLPDTEDKFAYVHLDELALAQGSHDFKLEMGASGIKVDWFQMRKNI